MAKKPMKKIDGDVLKGALKEEGDNMPNLQPKKAAQKDDRTDMSKTVQFPKYVWQQLKRFSDEDEPLRLNMLHAFKSAGITVHDEDLVNRRKKT